MLDEFSDRAPAGARGHRIRVPEKVAERALPSLIGMGINSNLELNGHEYRHKCGVITAAHIIDRSIEVRGIIYARDFPEIAEALRDKDLGMSYEIADAHVRDMREKDWTLTRITFMGAAILLREKAAYLKTFCRAA